jgi:tetratricopeptide (TPR) repeat protein
VALLAHLGVIGAALAFMRRAPLVSFGLLFYYLAHAVESGIIPIKDLMFEHRTYLPDAGLCVAAVAVLARLPSKAALPVFLGVSLLLSTVTWHRNNLWRDQIAFLNHAIQHAPEQPRNWVYLSKVYHKAGENGRALEFLNRELEANERRYGRLRVDMDTLVYWSKLLRLNGQFAKAEEVEARINTGGSRRDRERLLLHQGNTLLQAGEYEDAIAVYRKILAANPQQTSAAINLGVIALLQENYAEAIAIFERYPDHPVARSNLPKARAALEGTFRVDGVEEKVIEKAR